MYFAININHIQSVLEPEFGDSADLPTVMPRMANSIINNKHNNNNSIYNQHILDQLISPMQSFVYKISLMNAFESKTLSRQLIVDPMIKAAKKSIDTLEVLSTAEKNIKENLKDYQDLGVPVDIVQEVIGKHNISFYPL